MPRGLMGRSQRRRAVAAAVAVVVTFGVAACGGDDTKKESASSSAEATPTVKVIYSLYPAVLTSVTGANLVGQGFDKANGFKAEITPLATTGAEQMVLRRQADASFDAVSNGLGIYGAGGKDLRLIGLNTQHSSSMWCVREDSDIKSVADLKGKKVATAAAPTTNLLLNMMLDQGGLKESDIKRVNTKAIVDSVTAVQNGVVDAAWCIQPLVAISNHANKPLRVIWKAAENTPNMSDAIFTSAKLIEEQPETVQKFMDGVAQSHQFIQQQTEEAAATWAKEAKLDPKVAAEALSSYAKDFSVEVDPARVQNEIDTGVKLGTIDKSYPATDIVDSSFAKKALEKFPVGNGS